MLKKICVSVIVLLTLLICTACEETTEVDISLSSPIVITKNDSDFFKRTENLEYFIVKIDGVEQNILTLDITIEDDQVNYSIVNTYNIKFKVLIKDLYYSKIFSISIIDETEVTDQQLVDAVKNSLTLNNIVIDSFNLLTQSTTGVTIEWTSDNDAIRINNSNAIVTRGHTNIIVTLTADISKGLVSTTKEFVITVSKIDEKTDQQLVDELQELLELNETATANFTLELLISTGVSISWTSNNSAIAINGSTAVVTRSSINIEVILTANITKGEASATKTFTILVLKNDEDPDQLLVNEVKNLLTLNDTATANFALELLTSSGVSISWTSNNSAISINDTTAVVTRSSNDVEVTLTAYISKGEASATKTFTILVLKNEEKTDRQLVEEVKELLELDDVVYSDFTLTTEVSSGVIISWSSENSAISINGSTAVVTRGSADIEVVLTAEITKGTAFTNKYFIVTVAKEETVTITTINEVLTAGNYGDVFTIEGVVTEFIYNATNVKQGFYLTDNTGTIYIYGASFASQVVKNNYIKVTAELGSYTPTGLTVKYSQMIKATIEIINQYEEASFLTGVTKGVKIDDLYANGLQNRANIVYELEGVIGYSGDSTYRTYYLKDKSDNWWVNIYVSGSLTPANADAMFPYLAANVGKTIKVLFIINSSNTVAYRGVILKYITTETKPTATEVITKVGNPFADSYTTAQNINLAQSQDGYALIWESYNEYYISISNYRAAISIPASGIIEVTVLVMVYVDDDYDYKLFSVSLGTKVMDEEITLDIFSMNDLHGAINTSTAVNLAKTGQYLLNQKNSNPNSLIFANGDMFQGTAMSNYYYGLPIIEFMNYVGFNSMTIGNHEFDWGIDKIGAYKDENLANGEADFSILAANILQKSNNQPLSWTRPYDIYEVGDLKVGVIGVIGTGLESSIAVKYVTDYYFADVVTTVSKYATELRTQHNCDIIIVNGHMSEGDSGNPNQRLANLTGNAKINVLLNGHYHTTYYETTYGVPMIQSGSSNSHVGKISLTISPEKVITNVSGENISTSTFSQTNSYINSQIITKYENLIAPIFGEVLSTAKETMTKTSAGVWSSDVIAKYTNSDFGFVNQAGIRTVNISNNSSVTLAKILEIAPFDNMIVTFTMTGANVKSRIMAFSSSYYFSSNINATYETLNGSSFNDYTTYKIATIDYVYDKYFTAYPSTNTFDIMYNVLAEDVRAHQYYNGYFKPTLGAYLAPKDGFFAYYSISYANVVLYN